MAQRLTSRNAYDSEGTACAREVSLAALPGADGRYPVTETFSDGLGRVTNTLRTVWFNGARDPAFTPLTTRTEYPCGTDHCRAVTAPLGVQTVTREWRADGADVTETVTPGVTNRVTRYSGGATVEERFWDGKWTRETRSDTYGPDGCHIETAVTESSDCPAVTNSVTAYDFLGRVVSVVTPLGVTSNFYDGASSRILRVSRTGQPDTLYEYEAGSAGVPARTVLDVNGNGVIDDAGTDRISASIETYETDTSMIVWRVTSRSESVGGVTNALTVTREQLNGLSPALLSRTVTVSADAFTTTVARAFEPGTDVIAETSQAGTAAPRVRRTLYGRELESAGPESATLLAYDGFGRAVSRAVTNAAGTVSATAVVYDTLGNAVTNETAYGSLTAVTATAYDSQGRAVSQTDALGNAVFTTYDNLGQVLGQSGATYPVAYGYDTAGRMTALSTTRDGETWDTTLWLYDHATGLLMNKVYADNSRVSYTHTQSGQPRRTAWARGAWKENAYDALGQLASVIYNDNTPDVHHAYGVFGHAAASSNYVAQYEYANSLSGVATNETVTVSGDTAILARTLDNRHRLSVLHAGNAPVHYGYDAENRLAVTSNDAFTVAYALTADGWDAGYAVTLTNGLAITRAVTRDPHRRHLVTTVSNAVGVSSHSAIGYGYNILGNVTDRNADTFGYNARSEVTSADIGSTISRYAYDNIGNNLWVSVNAATNFYSANALNQYTAIDTTTLAYDADGNLLTNGDWSYTWDAENRLVATYSNNVCVVSNAYDHASRRVLKITPTATHTYVYDGWNLVQETISTAFGTTTNHYVWGKDLSGTMQGAGGVGGLLAVQIDGAWHFPFYDNNGNITDYINESGATVAHREYCPFGEALAATGPMAGVFNFWFSTKYLDEETGLYYYGYRFHNPELMRWLNRDPIGEKGGVNKYGFVNNDAVNKWDLLGMYPDSSINDHPIRWDDSCDCVVPNTVRNNAESDFKVFREKLRVMQNNKWSDLPDGSVTNPYADNRGKLTARIAKCLLKSFDQGSLKIVCRKKGDPRCWKNAGWAVPYSSTINLCYHNAETLCLTEHLLHEVVHSCGKIGHDWWGLRNVDNPQEWEAYYHELMRGLGACK
jgi:RHS repeat-associated protein